MSNNVNAVAPYTVNTSIIDSPYQPYKYTPWMTSTDVLHNAFAANTPKTGSVVLHKKDGTEETLTYTEGDFASMQRAAERLGKEGNAEDKLDAQQLMAEAYQILQMKQLLMTLEQNLFNTMIQNLQR